LVLHGLSNPLALNRVLLGDGDDPSQEEMMRKMTGWILVAILAVVPAVMGAPADADDSKPLTPTSGVEYKVVKAPDLYRYPCGPCELNAEKLATFLGAQSQDGWHLSDVFRDASSAAFYGVFERAK
jgi:hypothetical protein